MPLLIVILVVLFKAAIIYVVEWCVERPNKPKFSHIVTLRITEEDLEKKVYEQMLKYSWVPNYLKTGAIEYKIESGFVLNYVRCLQDIEMFLRLHKKYGNKE